MGKNYKHTRKIGSTSIQARRCSKEEKSEINKMREAGASYKEICEKFSLSKGTVSYYFGEGQKEKTKKRMNVLRTKSGGHLIRKWYWFREEYRAYVDKLNNTGRRRYFYYKFLHFINKQKGGKKIMLKELLNHLWPEEDNEKRTSFWTKCVLSGEDINLDADRNGPHVGALDHIIPRSRAGSNNFSNCQPLSARVNQMKHDMTNEEFIEQCKKILIYQGYTVNKVH